MKNYINSLTQKANESIEKARIESESIINNISSLINTELNFGKFHAYMDILKEIDFEKYIQIVESNKVKCNEILFNIESCLNKYKDINNMKLIDADSFKRYANKPSIFDTTDLKEMIDEQPVIRLFKLD